MGLMKPTSEKIRDAQLLPVAIAFDAPILRFSMPLNCESIKRAAIVRSVVVRAVQHCPPL